MIAVLFTILVVVLGIAFESFLIPLGGLSILLVGLLFAFGRVDWKQLLGSVVIVSVVFDVVHHYSLGVSLFVFSSVVLIYLLASLFLPSEDSLYGILPVIISSWLFYALMQFLPQWISFGEKISITWEMFFKSFFMAVLSSLLVWLLSLVFGRVRGDKLNSRLRLR